MYPETPLNLTCFLLQVNGALLKVRPGANGWSWDDAWSMSLGSSQNRTEIARERYWENIVASADRGHWAVGEHTGGNGHLDLVRLHI